MAGFTLNSNSRFLIPDGTVVGAYLASNWLPDQGFGGPPAVPATDEQTMTNGTVTFSGLEAGGSYVAGAEVGGTWHYIRFTVGQAVAQSGYSSVNAETITAEDLGEWTTLDIIEGIEVPESGRLQVSYAALSKFEDWVLHEDAEEEVDNWGDLGLFLDEDPVRINARADSEVIGAQRLKNNMEFWQLLQAADPLGLNKGLVLTEEAADVPISGPFPGPAFISIAAAPGFHDISIRVRLGTPTGGKFSVKERRLVAVTGDV